MDTDEKRDREKYPHWEITEKIIGAAMRVHNTLGAGFLERVYPRALVVALRRDGLAVEIERRFEVEFEGEPVGTYIADLVVGKAVIVECKAARSIQSEVEAVVLNYLKASSLRIALIINFGRTRLEFKRLIL